jgi:hypothetical protein
MSVRRRWSWLAILVVSLAVPSAAMARATSLPAGDAEADLVTTIQISSVTEAGAVPTVRFTARNVSSKPVEVLAWDLPGVRQSADILAVTRGGERVKYRGRLVKQAPATRADYLRLAPGDSYTTTVELADDYDLSLPGDYVVRLAADRVRVHPAQVSQYAASVAYTAGVQSSEGVLHTATGISMSAEAMRDRRSGRTSMATNADSRFSGCSSDQESTLAQAISKAGGYAAAGSAWFSGSTSGGGGSTSGGAEDVTTGGGGSPSGDEEDVTTGGERSTSGGERSTSGDAEGVTTGDEEGVTTGDEEDVTTGEEYFPGGGGYFPGGEEYFPGGGGYFPGGGGYFPGFEEYAAVGEEYVTWFGEFEQSRYDHVRSIFSSEASQFSGETVTIDCDCDDSAYAYVYPDDAYNIHVCKAFWNADLTGIDSMAGTLVHESSHFTVNGGTDDHVYGVSEGQELARSDPEKASNNADNIEHFVESL